MVCRLIVSYHIYQIVHDCVDETHIEHRHHTESLESPHGPSKTYWTHKVDHEFLRAYDRVIHRPNACQQKDHPDSISSIPVTYLPYVTSCKHEYWFATSAYLVEPKWTHYQLEYDEVSAEHDGYCSDAELDWNITPLSVCVTVPIEDDRLGIDDDDEEDDDVPITYAVERQFAKYQPTEVSIPDTYYGSGYCLLYSDRPADVPTDVYETVRSCNTKYYVLRRCTRVQNV